MFSILYYNSPAYVKHILLHAISHVLSYLLMHTRHITNCIRRVFMRALLPSGQCHAHDICLRSGPNYHRGGGGCLYIFTFFPLVVPFFRQKQNAKNGWACAKDIFGGGDLPTKLWGRAMLLLLPPNSLMLPEIRVRGVDRNLL